MENRRLNPDRRTTPAEIETDRRILDDRREVLRDKSLLGKLRKTPLFSELTNDEFKKVLAICSKVHFSNNDIIYHEGSTADNMFILTEGLLGVSLEGEELSVFTPISEIGGMGLFTRNPRSATIVAKTDCTLLKLTKIELSNLIKRTDLFEKRFYLGMIKELSNKLRNSNKFIIRLKKMHK